MSGHHPFSKLTKDFTPERRQRIEAMKAELRADIQLRESRGGYSLSQSATSGYVNVDQSEEYARRARETASTHSSAAETGPR